MTLIAITQRVDIIADYHERRDALDQRYVAWLQEAGFISAPIPNVWKSPTDIPNWLSAIQPRGLLLSGGNDIGTVSERDETEQQLLTWAMTMKIPVLGICRGMQMLGTFSKTPLVKIHAHVRSRHMIQINRNSVQQSYQSRMVNSYHQLALAQCPPDYHVLATSEDGCIEAIKHQYLPWEGWMWHPEREDCFSEQDLKQMRSLLLKE